jgi:hypothetical protein
VRLSHLLSGWRGAGAAAARQVELEAEDGTQRRHLRLARRVHQPRSQHLLQRRFTLVRVLRAAAVSDDAEKGLLRIREDSGFGTGRQKTGP